MKSSKQVQSDDQDTLYSYNSITYDTSETEVIDNRKDNFLRYGSATLAVVYMANTMLIPNMNQLFVDISFDNPYKIAFSVALYWGISFLILIPCYLVIKVCKQEGNPIYAFILKQDSNKLYNAFIYCNLIINTLGLFNIIVRLGDSLPKVDRWFYVEFHSLLTSHSPQLFFPTMIGYTAFVLCLFYVLYKISYFEHYYDIQYRLIFSFIGKILLNTAIFLLIYNKVPDCSVEYITMDENLFDRDSQDGLSEWISYCFNQICCISYPFFEVFYVKRETKKGYSKVQQCYWIQLLLRSLIFFYQVTTWGIIIRQDKMKYYYQPLLQTLNSALIFLIAISISSIYAHNYTLNKEILGDTIYTATEKDNKYQINQIYTIAALIFIGQMVISVLCRYFNVEFTQVKSLIYSLSYSVQTICFGFSCIAIPVYLWIKLKKLNFIAYCTLILYMVFFIGISSEPFIY